MSEDAEHGAGDAAGDASGKAGHEQDPSTEADAAREGEGPKDYGPPADTPRDPDVEGASAAEEGLSPWAPDAYDEEAEGPTTSTADDGD